MNVIVGFLFMARVPMIVDPMFALVIVVVNSLIRSVSMVMFMLVSVQMNVIVFMLVTMDKVTVPVIMRMGMSVLVLVLMFVHMASAHGYFLLFLALTPRSLSESYAATDVRSRRWH